MRFADDGPIDRYCKEKDGGRLYNRLSRLRYHDIVYFHMFLPVLLHHRQFRKFQFFERPRRHFVFSAEYSFYELYTGVENFDIAPGGVRFGVKNSRRHVVHRRRHSFYGIYVYTGKDVAPENMVQDGADHHVFQRGPDPVVFDDEKPGSRQQFFRVHHSRTRKPIQHDIGKDIYRVDAERTARIRGN